MRKMIKCSKCHGNMIIERDEYGRYLKCLQCGYQKDLAAPVKTKQLAELKHPVKLFHDDTGYKLSET